MGEVSTYGGKRKTYEFVHPLLVSQTCTFRPVYFELVLNQLFVFLSRFTPFIPRCFDRSLWLEQACRVTFYHPMPRYIRISTAKRHASLEFDLLH